MITSAHDNTIGNNQERLPPKRILFANSKGGCGKSTLATNLASFYARQGVSTTLLDYDPQGWASQWLKRRDEHTPLITGIEAFRPKTSSTTRNWFMRVPRDTQRVIIDTPAGLNGNELADALTQADLIIVPVLPSTIDIHCATRFISSILLNSVFRRGDKKLVVVANRVRKNTLSLDKLDLFLNSLKLPRAGNIRDTQNYVHCIESGGGIADFPSARNQHDREQWNDLVTWIDQQLNSKNSQEESGKNTVTGVADMQHSSSKSGTGVYTVV